MNRSILALALGAVVVCAQAQQPPQTQAAAPPSPEQRVAMLKQWLQTSQAQLRAYEWIETTVLTKGGEEKSRKQNRCYYGADGKVQKVPVAQAEAKSGGPPGILPPGRIIKKVGENKKEDLVEYMQKAAALAQSYIPPDPNRIQQAVKASKFSVTPGQRARLDFHDYLKSGDLLSIEVESPTNRLLGMAVSSYLDTPEDPVKVNVAMGVLPDGTIHTSRTTLDAKAEDVVVTIENTGHRRTGG